MRTKKQWLNIILTYITGVLLYVFAVLFTFGFSPFYGLSPFIVIGILFIGGVGSLALGYGSVIALGGMMSLKLFEFIARATGTRQVIEVIPEEEQVIDQKMISEEQKMSGHGITRHGFMLYMSALIFGLSVTISWNVHNLNDPRTAIFYPLLRELDIFLRPVGISPLLYAVDVIPSMVVLVAISGAIPSIVLPFFRRFKITGVNGSPLHIYFLSVVIKPVTGLGVVLTLVGHIYQTLWYTKGPYYYYYILPAVFGLSLHYAIGSLLGRDKSEMMVQNLLETRSGKRVTQGVINIQGVSTGRKRKLS